MDMRIPSYLSPWWTKVLLHLKASGVRRLKPWGYTGDVGLAMDDWEAPASCHGKRLQLNLTLTYEDGVANAWLTVNLETKLGEHRVFEWDSMDKAPDVDLLMDAAFGFIKEPDLYE